MTPLSEHFTLEEMTASQTAARWGIDNTPDSLAKAALRDLCANILEPLRAKVGPIRVSSGYRAPEVNKRVGGAATSQHCFGQAADITVPGMSVPDLFNLIRKSPLPFDQVIEEYGTWVHVSYSSRNRRQALIARRVGGRAQYTPAED